ncbi:MAG: hypothetical protein AAGG75_01070 [Bacteroidota bacterium]
MNPYTITLSVYCLPQYYLPMASAPAVAIYPQYAMPFNTAHATYYPTFLCPPVHQAAPPAMAVPAVTNTCPSLIGCVPTQLSCPTMPMCLPNTATCPQNLDAPPPTLIGCPVAPRAPLPTPPPPPAVPQPQPPAVGPATDDLKKIEGIGPKIEKLLRAEGIITFAELSKTRLPRLRGILKAAGKRYAIHDPKTWAKQARLAAAGKWKQLKKLQDELMGGK